MARTTEPHLDRGLTLVHATSLNVANMLGAGPFFTMPLILAAMHGPQCMVGWVVALVIVMCDGLVWSELGAAFPGSGGTYHYYREIFKGTAWGRFLPFIFIWQFLIAGTLELASGYIAVSQFAQGLWPAAKTKLDEFGLPDSARVGVVATGTVVIIFVLLCQRIQSLGRLITFIVIGVLAAVGTVIVLGALHFDASLITFPENAFRINKDFALGLGAAMSVAVYDYLGYYNICNLGEEVRSPTKTIPRSVMLSVVIVAAIYMAMNLAFIGVVPWQDIVQQGTLANTNVAGAFMTKLLGSRAAALFTGLVIWTCLASVFAMTLGYSRILYAAAKDGDFFSYFAALHPTKHYPWAALALLCALTAAWCYFSLGDVVAAAVVVRILPQFIGQILALHVARRSGRHKFPFRMWLYPLPGLIALVGWVLLLATTSAQLWCVMLGVYASGIMAYFVRKLLTSRTGIA
jgi:amino acid transporter